MYTCNIKLCCWSKEKLAVSGLSRKFPNFKCTNVFCSVQIHSVALIAPRQQRKLLLLLHVLSVFCQPGMCEACARLVLRSLYIPASVCLSVCSFVCPSTLWNAIAQQALLDVCSGHSSSHLGFVLPIQRQTGSRQ